MLVLQVAGTKQWDVFEPVPPDTDLEDPSVAPRIAFRAELERGDVLYLPSGVPHPVESTTNTSIHLTIGFVPPTWREAVEAAVADDDDAELDAPLPARFALGDGAALVPGMATRLRRLAERLASADAADSAARTAQRFWAERVPVVQGQLGQLLRLDAIGPDTRLIRPAASIARVMRDTDGRLVVVTGDRSLAMPAALAPAIEFILGCDGGGLTPTDLAPYLDPESRLVLVRRLVREGILATTLARTPATPDA